ncbi:MAG: DNA repair protein RecN [Verrucomicrobiota bacterium]|nr:DNA repair protein RecN [Verrucomicrobiota bacterium]
MLFCFASARISFHIDVCGRMLTDLRIKNLALVDDLSIELGSGYNAVTGETGAGKSVIIGALGLVLGERADRTLLRDGSEQCSVEAIIDITGMSKDFHDFLESCGLEPCESNQLLLKRVFSASGTNRQFINGSPTTLNLLASVGEWLVDIHGPHDHQSLLKASRQLEILDAYGGLENQRKEFALNVDQLIALERKKAELVIDEDAYKRELDLLKFQVNEIESAQLSEDDEEGLEQSFKRATNSARLAELVGEVKSLVNDSEPSSYDLMLGAGRLINEMVNIDDGAEELLNQQSQISEQINELSGAIEDYCDRLNLDPNQIRNVEERYNLVQSLKRKYGDTLKDVIAFSDKALARLEKLESRDEELASINAQIDLVRNKIKEQGRRLSDARKEVAPKLVGEAEKQLNDLGFLQSRFDLEIIDPNELGQESTTISRTGFDQIEFLFAPNPGEPFKPLKSIASSGEMARVMLALKTVLSSQDSIPILVFDEVDANVGGETAAVVGQKMNQIGKKRQVLCISHLAPVAAAGNSHYLVEKEVENGRTLTRVRLLEAKARIDEITRMLGGSGDAARQHAEELLKT